MTEPSDEDLMGAVRTHWERTDPVPEGMVARLQAATALAASETDLDIELMLLVERSEELAGARGGATSAYTLRFAHDGVDLLLRVSTDGTGSRIDGWVVPPSPVSVTVQRALDLGWADDATLEVPGSGRFELPDLTPGMLRLRLAPADGSTPFMTPAFEI